MSRVVWAACTFAFSMLQSPVYAAPVTVSGDAPRKEITVVVENSTLDLVLQDLAQKYGFKLVGIQNASTGDPLSATLSGSLDNVLGRLLRNRNYVIVRSADNASGVEKVMLLDSTYGAAPTKVGRNPNIEGAEELLQALSGGSSE